MHTRSKARNPRGMAALRTGACVVTYEYWMLKEGLRWLASLKRAIPPPNQALVNAAIEATLIHARNLLDFFSTRGIQDDVKMRDYLTRPPQIALPYLRENRRRINRKLAHPSCSSSRMSSSWAFGAIEAEIDTAIRRFLERLARDEPQLRKQFRIP